MTRGDAAADSALPPLGLIAGEGRLPELVADGMAQAGRRVACLALDRRVRPTLARRATLQKPVSMLQIGRWIRVMRRWGVEEAVMVGRVRKDTMYDPVGIARSLPDARTLRLFFHTLRHDRRSQTLLAAVADEIASGGIQLIDSTRYIPDHLATPGHLAGPPAPPGGAVQQAVDFGWPILMRMNDLEVGQAVAVRGGDIVAVEAIEGTDAMIQRAGALARGKRWVLLKGAGPKKDMRFDVPTVGVRTLEKLAAAGAIGFAVQAGQVILIDKPEVLAAADRLKVTLLGV